MGNAKLSVVTDEPIGVISPRLHGHFAEHLGRCCNDGLWVGPDSNIPNEGGLRTDIMAALKRIGIPLLRWPGGCYADTYHWRDGIGTLHQRPRSLGESCGLTVVEDNGLGTHEFIQLCREIGAEPYLAGNMGSGSPQEMMSWIEYCNTKYDTTLARERAANGHPEPMNVKCWGVGNENWGCGGNYDAAQYAKEYRRYATFCKMSDNTVELVACGLNERTWNQVLMETMRNHLDLIDHLSVHRYYNSGHATDFTEKEYYSSMKAGELVDYDIQYTQEIISFYAAGRKKIGISFDEWGIWHPQAVGNTNYEAANTLRDAVAAAGVLDAFHRRCETVSIACLAQIVNVLQTLVQTDGEKMWLTPTYHLFGLYAAHRGAEALRVDVESPSVDADALSDIKAGPVALVAASASRKDGKLILSITNRHNTEAMEIAISVRGAKASGGTIQTLTADKANAVNSADDLENVKIIESALNANVELKVTLPAHSVSTLCLNCS